MRIPNVQLYQVFIKQTYRRVLIYQNLVNIVFMIVTLLNVYQMMSGPLSPKLIVKKRVLILMPANGRQIKIVSLLIQP